MNQEDIQKELEFVMKVGIKMKNFMLEQLVKEFESHDERSRVLFNLMANFVCNTMHDVSPPENVDANVMEIVNSITEWVRDKNVGVRVGLNQVTNQIIKKEGLH